MFSDGLSFHAGCLYVSVMRCAVIPVQAGAVFKTKGIRFVCLLADIRHGFPPVRE